MAKPLTLDDLDHVVCSFRAESSSEQKLFKSQVFRRVFERVGGYLQAGIDREGLMLVLPVNRD